MGGVAATEKYVIASDRELDDTTDVFKCFDAKTGDELWAVRYPALGQLDFGNSPRATPLIDGDRVFLAGAFGNLLCVDLKTGTIVWERDIRDEFKATDERKWGYCSSPLLADGKLIVNPGGKNASLVALDPKTGKAVWRSPGKPASYGNLIVGTFGGKRQIVGFDADSLGGWDLATGKRLWALQRDNKSEFNVATPNAFDGKLVIAWEANGTFVFDFDRDGKVIDKPLAHYPDLAPDTHTPVIAAGRVFGAWSGLHCLDVKANLKPVWTSARPGFKAYLTVVATDDRVLVVTLKGELILIDAKADTYRELSHVAVLDDEDGCYSHPAFVGTRMYIRGNSGIRCMDLKP